MEEEPISDTNPSKIEAKNGTLIYKKPEKRMIISKIKLFNFKSYQGEHIIGPLNTHFTAVIGANGSGKSNQLEALVFVFGKRASKLRLQSLKQLIHYSKNFPNLKKAEVTVYFEDHIENLETGEWVPVPNSQFNISRSVEKTGIDGQKIKYHLNGEEALVQQITEKLIHKGLDLEHNRFMILQGEVEQISLMKPLTGDPDRPGQLEYLEDIIGTNKYVKFIEENELKQSEQIDCRKKCEGVVSTLKRGLEDLEPHKNAAIKYAKVELS